MGKTFENVTIKNFVDIVMQARGIIKEEEIRIVETKALVDTGSAYLCLPPGDIEKLGLAHSTVKQVNTANGIVNRRIFYGAFIIIKDREIQMQIMENTVGTPPLIGYLVLEAMDFLVDSKSQQIIPNPAHEGKWIIDLY